MHINIIFCIFLFMRENDEKTCFSVEKNDFTQQKAAEHLFAGQNKQQLTKFKPTLTYE